MSNSENVTETIANADDRAGAIEDYDGELAAFLASRICHDLISPVGAINNGLELIEDTGAADMHAFAMDLIAKSARQASVKLQVARLAFGASSDRAGEMDLGDVKSVAEMMMDLEKAALDWRIPLGAVPKARAKLVLNLIILAVQALPRGGVVRVTAPSGGIGAGLAAMAAGERARVPAVLEAFLAEGVPGRRPKDHDARNVQAFWTLRLAALCGHRLSVHCEQDTVLMTCD